MYRIYVYIDTHTPIYMYTYIVWENAFYIPAQQTRRNRLAHPLELILFCHYTPVAHTYQSVYIYTCNTCIYQYHMYISEYQPCVIITILLHIYSRVHICIDLPHLYICSRHRYICALSRHRYICALVCCSRLHGLDAAK